MDFEEFVLAASLTDLDDEIRAREHADAVEFRMDLAAEFADSDPLAALRAYDGELPVIATNRASWESGEAEDDESRLADLAGAAELACVGAVDVELRSLTQGEGDRVAAHARQTDTAVIASVHDFEGTPPKPDLRGELEEATDRADVGKLAVTAEDRGDVLDLLTVTHEFAEAGARVATMAMGEPGRHSRAVAPLYGSAIGYAPIDPEDATAPGQYDLETLSRLVDQLR
jgi:3-dehydroquinate dehydratase-1